MKHFSERESAIIKIIGKKSVTVEDISNQLFKLGAPLDSGVLITNSIRRIIKKCQHHELEWTLSKDRSKGKMTLKRVKS